MVLHGDGSPLRERRLHGRQVEGIGPVALIRGTEHFEDLKDLINLTITSEQRTTLGHFSKNAASRPEIHTKGVGFLAEQNFRASVPKCNYLMGVGLDGQTEGTGKTKISQLDLSTSRVHK